LKDEEGEDFVLEVKSVTLVKNKIAMFPDAVTLRGKNHLQALKELVKKNQKTGVLFVCQRPDATSFQPMWQRDDKFCYALLEAHKFGVKIWCITLSISENDIEYNKEIPIYLDQN
jgi:sugar fermentation stimulation protein A